MSKIPIGVLFIVISFVFLAPSMGFAKGVAKAPFVMKGTIDTLKIDGESVSFFFTGEIVKSQWSEDLAWDLKASVSKLPVKVSYAFAYKRDDPMWGFKFKEEQSKAVNCANGQDQLEITFLSSVIHFSQFEIKRIEGEYAQIEGCAENTGTVVTPPT